jgi:hypothetical protein
MGSRTVNMTASGGASKIAAALKTEQRVRVESDGTPTGTQVLVGGCVLLSVVDVKWSMDQESWGRVTITLDDVDMAIAQGPERWNSEKATGDPK